jgi:hypothetical protein
MVGIVGVVGVGLMGATIVVPAVFLIALPIAFLTSRGGSGVALVRRHNRVQLAALAAIASGGLAIMSFSIFAGAH